MCRIRLFRLSHYVCASSTTIAGGFAQTEVSFWMPTKAELSVFVFPNGSMGYPGDDPPEMGNGGALAAAGAFGAKEIDMGIRSRRPPLWLSDFQILAQGSRNSDYRLPPTRSFPMMCPMWVGDSRWLEINIARRCFTGSTHFISRVGRLRRRVWVPLSVSNAQIRFCSRLGSGW